MADHHHEKIRSLSLAFALNACFALIEFAGGVYTHSSAIIADAIHDSGDTLAIGAGIILEKLSRRKSAPGFSYGYTRLPLLSALLLSLILISSSAVMLIRAVSSFDSAGPVDSIGMLWLSVLGIAINGAAFFSVKKSAHMHQHAHAHAHDPNSNAIMLHMLEDVLGWIAVLGGSILMYFTHWYWIDELLTIAIALFILFNSGKNLFSTIRILVQATPQKIDMQELTEAILRIKGVKSIHNLHIWSLNGSDHVGTVHILPETVSVENMSVIRMQVLDLMRSYGIADTTVQVDSDDSDCHSGYN
jgi:cobalt-zinc-cadmium efflux system protein